MREGSFTAAIEAHLELKRRNERLEGAMPLARYREDPVGDPPPVEPARAVDADAPTNAANVHTAPWDDADSWWNVRDPAFDWGA